MSKDLIFVRDRRRGRHYTIDNEVYDARLGVYALAVYNAFSRHARFEGDDREKIATTHKELAEELLCGVTSIKTAIKRLVEDRFVLKLRRKRGESYVYVLLEVEKKSQPVQFLRRADGVSQNTPNRTGGADRRNTADPGRGAAKGSRHATQDSRGAPKSKGTKGSAGKGLPAGAKSKTPIGKGKSLGAQGAQAPFHDPYEKQANFSERVWNWHKQVEANSRGKKKYNQGDITRWLTLRISKIGLERAIQIFEHVAKGVSPDIHAFWQALKAEADRSNKTVPRFVEESCKKHPLTIAM